MDYNSTIKRVKGNMAQVDEVFLRTARMDIHSLLNIITELECENERLTIKLEEKDGE